jgi:hypothetical protein
VQIDLEYIERELLIYQKTVFRYTYDLCSFYAINFDEFTKDPYRFINKSFPKLGSFKVNDSLSYDYHFHGAGCDVKVSNGLKLNYDFAPLNNSFVKTSSWKFQVFLESKYSDLTIKTIEIHELFELLVIQNRILQKSEFGSLEIVIR